MSSGEGDSTLLLPGFPIRTPSDHSSVDSSPRLIAASHVLHRLLVPRHPPCALNNLATKMLASTMQFSNHERTPAHTPPPNPQPTRPPTPRHDTRRTHRTEEPNRPRNRNGRQTSTQHPRKTKNHTKHTTKKQ